MDLMSWFVLIETIMTLKSEVKNLPDTCVLQIE